MKSRNLRRFSKPAADLIGNGIVVAQLDAGLFFNRFGLRSKTGFNNFL
jgi:hypothetical protein